MIKSPIILAMCKRLFPTRLNSKSFYNLIRNVIQHGGNQNPFSTEIDVCAWLVLIIIIIHAWYDFYNRESRRGWVCKCSAIENCLLTHSLQPNTDFRMSNKKPTGFIEFEIGSVAQKSYENATGSGCKSIKS